MMIRLFITGRTSYLGHYKQVMMFTRIKLKKKKSIKTSYPCRITSTWAANKNPQSVVWCQNFFLPSNNIIKTFCGDCLNNIPDIPHTPRVCTCSTVILIIILIIQDSQRAHIHFNTTHTMRWHLNKILWSLHNHRPVTASD